MRSAAGSSGTQQTLTELWASGASLTEVVQESFARTARADRHEWLLRLPEQRVLEQAAAVERRAAAMGEEQRASKLPLMGMTFSVKDNIAVAGLPMTNGCDYRSGGAPVPSTTAAAVTRLMDAGAVLLGKNNMDCAATGLVGIRSVYGAVQNALDRDYISGGSSSGSGVCVSLGQVSFSLGTDTAGSGRVPAMLNNIVGLKASRGLISTHGLAPACRSLDCISIFATSVPEARTVLQVASGDGRDDAWDRAPGALTMGPRLPGLGAAKFTFGVPSKEFLDFSSFGAMAQHRTAAFAAAWAASVKALEAIGGTCVEVDYAPFQQTARLLYEGPWIAERYSGLQDLFKTNPDAIWPTVREIVEPGKSFSAQQAFEAYYKLQELKVAADRAMAEAGAQVLVTPTAGMTYTIKELQADPIALNSNMGRYTNHMNLLDLCGIAVPTVFTSIGLPFGVTVSAAAGSDAFVCDIGSRLHKASGLTVGAMSSTIDAVEEAVAKRFPKSRFLQGVPTFKIVVSGAHMEGLALSWQLTERGGCFVRRARTAPMYKLLAFEGMKPPRPGMAGLGFEESKEHGRSIEVEIWELPAAAFASFCNLVAQPLGIGWVHMEDGSKVQGFRLVDHGADSGGGVGAAGEAEGAARKLPTEISEHGGWRNYLAKA